MDGHIDLVMFHRIRHHPPGLEGFLLLARIAYMVTSAADGAVGIYFFITHKFCHLEKNGGCISNRHDGIILLLQ